MVFNENPVYRSSVFRYNFFVCLWELYYKYYAVFDSTAHLPILRKMSSVNDNVTMHELNLVHYVVFISAFLSQYNSRLRIYGRICLSMSGKLLYRAVYERCNSNPRSFGLVLISVADLKQI